MINLARKIYKKTFGFPKRTYFNVHPADYKGQDVADLIYEELQSGKPLMISRMGRTEFSCVNFYKKTRNGRVQRDWNYIRGRIDKFDYDPTDVHKIHQNAGFFPPTHDKLDQFSELMLDCLPQIDILASIINLENEFGEELRQAKRIWFEDLNPYYHQRPWSRILKGKKVLVIHPFTASIKSQFEKRELIFENPDILPEFELITYTPVQSIAGNYKSLPYKDWFEALESMKSDISKLDFDVALIGCGAYGMPLAAHVKQLGKQGIHIGGAIQILFGILGKRWESEYDISHLVNDNWVRPMVTEIPDNHNLVEGGCYW
ncbi:hypothetical protein [Aureitalea marina]|uniref:Uncharacterized protein n=1 Tax=Aureitalea marina TaxID=930804 RepID=A0A2S7KMQ1_9FLAO|nr:hypothetical protein [Aureitalea marina]PQB03881.1 hypothetical protein BST85_02390 [Aureitalea marina]